MMLGQKAARVACLRRHRAVRNSIPLVALKLSGGNWYWDDANHVTPDGWMVANGDGTYSISTTLPAHRLALSVAGGSLFYEDPSA